MGQENVEQTRRGWSGGLMWRGNIEELPDRISIVRYDRASGFCVNTAVKASRPRLPLIRSNDDGLFA